MTTVHTTPNEVHQTSDIWMRFEQTGDQEARNTLIKQYVYLVKIITQQILRYLPPNLEREDLESAGVVGLIKAVDQFDTGRRVKFETFADKLIRGAILDFCRDEGWAPRSVRAAVKWHEIEIAELTAQLGHPPVAHEIARAMGMILEEYYSLLLLINRTQLQSTNVVTQSGDQGSSLADVVHDDQATPSEIAERNRIKRILGQAINNLPSREQLVILFHFYEEMSCEEIGLLMKISESRVWQLRSQAIKRLKNYLRNRPKPRRTTTHGSIANHYQ